MERVEYIGKTKIKDMKCNGCELNISDFEYTSEEGKSYMMCIRNKGYHGRYHVIKSLLDDSIYIVNNLWISDSDSDSDSDYVLIKSEISEEDIKEMYKGEVKYLNKIEYIDGEIDDIKKDCEESIKNHKINEYIISNTEYYLKMSTDSEDCWLQFYKKPNIEAKKESYNVWYGCNYGDNEEVYEKIDDGIKKSVEIINNHYENIINNYNNDDDDDIVDKLLKISKKNKVKKEIIEELSEYGISMYKVSNTLGGKYFNYFLTNEMYGYVKNKVTLRKLLKNS